MVTERGIRCCYHGWLYDVDGRLLETPGEPADSKAAEKLRATVRQGAYPVHEHKGLIFAYLGPSEDKPRFTILDTFDIPGDERVPYTMDYPCNWLQIFENAMDPVHSVFLHTRVSGAQFSDSWGELSVVDFHERPIGWYYTNCRRVEQHIWTRMHDVLLPNLSQAGAVLSIDGKRPKYFGRNSFTRWVVPVDDTHTKILAWAHFSDRADPVVYKTRENIEKTEQGEIKDRTYDERQRRPSDNEAFIGQGTIADLKKQHLSGTDKGVAMYRSRVRTAIRNLKKGKCPTRPGDLGDRPIPTYGGDTVLRIPRRTKGDDRKFLLDVSQRLAKIYMDADRLRGEARDHAIIDGVKKLETSLA